MDNTLRKAAEQALEALESAANNEGNFHDYKYAANALRQALAQTEQAPHQCELNSPYQAYGVAIEDVYEDDEGRFWAGNGEYGSQVNYCPVCGTKAPKQIEGDKHD